MLMKVIINALQQIELQCRLLYKYKFTCNGISISKLQGETQIWYFFTMFYTKYPAWRVFGGTRIAEFPLYM